MQPSSPSNDKPQLKKVLSRFDLVMMGIGCTIGVGIYILSGFASAQYAGPAIIISFVLAGVLCAIVGLCYGELSSIYPVAGSAYSYSYHAMGRAMGWILGWTLLLEYLIASSTVAAGWSSYFSKFLHSTFGYEIPLAISTAPGSIPGHPLTINLLSILIMTLIAYLGIRGMRKSANFNNIVATVKILILLFFMGFCISHVNPHNWHPFIPERTFTLHNVESFHGIWDLTIVDIVKSMFSPNIGASLFGEASQKFWHYGWSGVLTGTAIVFFTYVGFDMVSSVSEETEHPQTDIPFGIIGSLVIVSVLYIAVTLVLTGVIPPVVNGQPNPLLTQSDAAAPLAIAIEHVTTAKWPSTLLSLGALAGITTTLLTLNLGVSRIILAMSRDGFLPKFLSHVHPQFQTPDLSTIFVSTIISVVSALLPVHRLAALCNLGTLAAFVFVCLGVLIMRAKDPERKRPFKCPGSPYVPILGIVSCIAVTMGLPLVTWAWFGAWMLIGVLIYYLYNRRKVARFPHQP